MEFKTMPVYPQEVKSADRTITGFAAVTGNIDQGNDRIKSGAFTQTLYHGKNRFPHLWQHDYEAPPIATITDIQEVKRTALPSEVLADYPDASGGLQVSRKYLDTPRADEVYQGILAGAIQGMSFGFEVPKGKSQFVKSADGLSNIRELMEIRLIETSDTPFPMNPAAKAKKSFMLFNLLDALDTIDDLTTLMSLGQSLTSDQLAACQQYLALLIGLLESAQRADMLEDMMNPTNGVMSQTMVALRKAITGASWLQFKGALPFHATPKADEGEAWDGPAQVAKASTDDLKAMCAWVDSENADTKSAYKLPHHQASSDHAVVWKGVAAAMGALLGSRGGVDIPDTDRKAVYAHLSRHYDQFGKDAPDFKVLSITWSVQDARALLASGVNFKQGRMISAANEATIRKAMDAIGTSLETLESLLSTDEASADDSAKSLTDPATLLALLEK